MTHFTTISADELAQLTMHKCIILDVRNQNEHDDVRLACDHVLIPLPEFDPVEFMATHGVGADDTVYILCHAGMRAAMAAQKLADAGCKGAHVIEGGIVACAASGHDLIKGSA
jgi:rhodanese-related sulfurtransferase